MATMTIAASAPISRRLAEGRKGGSVRPTFMTKRKGSILCLLFAALLLLAGAACAAEGDPIVCSMELDPNKLTGPGTVNVTITISNSGDTDLKDPVVLYDPAAQIVSDFGTNGAALLKAGESMTWTGTYDVSEGTLENGAVVYFVKYTLYKESGEAVDQSQPIRQAISLQKAETDIDVKRTISPTIAGEGKEVVVRYDITNSGTVTLTGLTIQENKNIHKQKQKIPDLEPGKTAVIEYKVTMGKKDLTSGATITYQSETNKKSQTYTVEDQKITYGESSLTAKLTSSVKGVVENGAVTLTLELKNTGSVDYSDLRVTDPTLGDVFSNQQLKAGASLTLEKEITVPATADYQFTVTATDQSGAETSVATDAVTVTAMAPEDALTLDVSVTADRTEVFEQPGRVRFTISVANTSQVEAKNVVVSHGDTQIYTFESIPAGETRTLSRDTALSMAGRFRFTVTAQDPLESNLTFQSNEIQIAFSVPTPAPATPTPLPDPTPEPVFEPATVPPITDPSVGAVPKTIQSVLLPVLVLVGLLLIASCVLLIVAAKRRSDRRKASEAAIDQLERAKRRDYVTPAEEEEPQPQEEAVTVESDALNDEPGEEPELPHLKYARSVSKPVEPEGAESYSAIGGGYYDEDMATGLPSAEPHEAPAEDEADAVEADRLVYGGPEDDEQDGRTDGGFYDDAVQPGDYDGAEYGDVYDDAYDEVYDGGMAYEPSDYADDGAYDGDDAQSEFEPYDDEETAQWPDAPENGAAQPYDDSMFRRPAGETEPPRRRRSRGQHFDS